MKDIQVGPALPFEPVLLPTTVLCGNHQNRRSRRAPEAAWRRSCRAKRRLEVVAQERPPACSGPRVFAGLQVKNPKQADAGLSVIVQSADEAASVRTCVCAL